MGCGRFEFDSHARTLPAAFIAAGIGVAWYMGDQPQEPERTVLQLPAPVVEAQSQAPVSAPLPGDGTTSGAQNADSAAASEEDATALPPALGGSTYCIGAT